MRVFPDTNVWVSALATRGLCEDIVRSLLRRHGRGNVTVLAGEPVVAETMRILTEKFHASESELSLVRTAFGIAKHAPAVNDDPPVEIPDPDDVPIIVCALAAGAEVFITGDKALLDMHSIAGMSIISPREFLESLD